MRISDWSSDVCSSDLGTAVGTQIGPLIDDAALAKVDQHIADAVAKGGKVLIGGGRHAIGGRFYAPTVLRDVTPDMLLTREETFGPLAPVLRLATADAAIAQANATEFGLAEQKA